MVYLRTIITFLILVNIFQSAKANIFKTDSSQTIKTQSIIIDLINSLPIKTENCGIIMEIESPIEPIKVTTNMGEVPTENMLYFSQNPEIFKRDIMQNFEELGYPLINIAKTALNAGVPFMLHVYSSNYQEGFSVMFSIDELLQLFSKK